MSKVSSSSSDLTLNCDGGSSSLKIQIDGTEKASISSAGLFTSTSIDATKLTGNLPALNASSLTSVPAGNLTGALPAISGASLTNLPAAGITEYDTWRVSSTFAGDATPISTNLGRASYDFEKIGTGMSQSSGVFTFPSTGKWIVRWQFIHGAYVANDYGAFNIKVSVDGGSSWNTRSTQHSGASTAVRFSGGMIEHLVDVTSTSNIKVRFDVIQANQGNKVYTGSGANHCAMIFIRIGDT